MSFTCMQPTSGYPLMAAAHSKEPDGDGNFPADDEIMAWACVFSQILMRCFHCKSPKIRKSALVNFKKNGNQYWSCDDCGKQSTPNQLRKSQAVIFDLAWITSSDKHKGEGHAKAVLEYLKTQCDRLNTQISASSEGGIALCKSVGMIERGPILAWHREGYEYAADKTDAGNVQ